MYYFIGDFVVLDPRDPYESVLISWFSSRSGVILVLELDDADGILILSFGYRDLPTAS